MDLKTLQERIKELEALTEDQAKEITELSNIVKVADKLILTYSSIEILQKVLLKEDVFAEILNLSIKYSKLNPTGEYSKKLKS